MCSARMHRHGHSQNTTNCRYSLSGVVEFGRKLEAELCIGKCAWKYGTEGIVCAEYFHKACTLFSGTVEFAAMISAISTTTYHDIHVSTIFQ